MTRDAGDPSLYPPEPDPSEAAHSQERPSGSLVLVATPIGNLGDISRRAIEILSRADVVCCEDTRHTGLLLKRLGIESKRLLSLHQHNEAERASEIVDRIGRGELVVLVSDAGTPVVSDPGERLVARVASADLLVSTVPGPSAAIAALSISGLPAEQFTFVGFLPRKGRIREEQIDAIATSRRTSILYESPLRIHETLEALIAPCGDDRSIAIVRELTKLHEEVWRGTLGEALARSSGRCRGEHVLVVGPARSEAPGAEVDLEERLGRLFDAGLSRRDAASALEILLEIPHRIAYQSALRVETTSK